MTGNFMDGLGTAIGCLLLIALLVGVAVGACAVRCPYRVEIVNVEEAP